MKYLSRAYSTLLPRGRVLLQDDMSVTHAQLLEVTLSSYLSTANALQKDDPAPYGSHLIYFNHAAAESTLAKDGYDNLQAPLGDSYLRRWIGGAVTFNLSHPLRLGLPAFCEERVQSAENTSKTKSTEKISVTIDREIRQGTNWSIKESRTLLYLTASDRMKAGLKRLNNSASAPATSALLSHSLTVTDLLVFRYSALTFNAHKIHYDPLYAKQEEGMETGVIAQGPLLVTLVLRWLEPNIPKDFGIYRIVYRVVESVAVNEEISLQVFKHEDQHERFRVLIVGNNSVKFDAELEVSRKTAD